MNFENTIIDKRIIIPMLRYYNLADKMIFTSIYAYTFPRWLFPNLLNST